MHGKYLLKARSNSLISVDFIELGFSSAGLYRNWLEFLTIPKCHTCNEDEKYNCNTCNYLRRINSTNFDVASLRIALFLIGLGLLLSQANFWELFFGLPGILIALLLIPPITAGLTPGLLLFAFLAWKNQYRSRIWRIYYSLIALAACGFVSFLINWNLLGIQV